MAGKEADKRFWARVKKAGADGCWIWQGAVRAEGQGVFYATRGDAGSRMPAHRYAYEQAGNPVPYGARIQHRCNNARCVNPTHLYIAADVIKPKAGDGRLGHKNPNAVLSQGHASMIRILHGSGFPVLMLADLFNCSRHTIYAVINGKTHTNEQAPEQTPQEC